MKYIKICFSLMAVFLLLLFPNNTNTALAASSITYKNILPTHQIHTYRFSNSQEGIVNVNFLNSTNVMFSIIGINDDVEYFSGDVLPVGEYEISFSPNGSLSNNYEIVVTGDIGIIGQTTLPSLAITSPLSNFTRLNKGVFTINYKGSTNGVLNYYNLNRNNSISLTSPFSVNLNILFGHNKINTYSELANKNSISDVRTVVSPGVLRISGSNRYASAAAISKEIEKEGYEIDTVIITSGSNFADGLPGVVLGHKYVAPILTTSTVSLPIETKNEVARLGATKAIILGGTGAISSNVESELVGMGLTVERISGIDRYEVSTKIAEKIVDENSYSAIVVNGLDYPDGLLATPYAGNTQQPILYTRPDALPSSIKTFLTNHPNIQQFTIVGGPLAVSQAVVSELEQIGSVLRVGGADRYETGINLGYALNFQKRKITLVSNEIDGVPAALLSSLKDSQLMLTRTEALPSSIDGYIQGYRYEKLFDNIYIIGGTGAVSQEIEDYLKGIIN